MTQSWIDGVVIVSAAGDVDLLAAPRLRNAIEVVANMQPTGLVVDLSDVPLLASAGMQVLVDAQRLLARGTGFAVVADGLGTSRVLAITGLTETMAVVPTVDEALTILGQAVPPSPADAGDARRPPSPDPSEKLYRHFYPEQRPEQRHECPGGYVGRHRSAE